MCRTMHFGLNTYLFTFPFTNASVKLFPKFKAWGAQAIEIAVDDPAGFDPARVRAALDANGLVCNTVCGAFGPERDLRGTPEQQRTALEYLRDIMRVMPALGARMLAGPMYSATGRAQAYGAREKRQHRATVVKRLRTLAREAEAQGVRLAIEPLNRFETDFLNTIDDTLALIDTVGSPALGVLYDTFHANIEEKDQARAIKRVGKRLFHFHACGCDRGTPGRDHIDWPGIAGALRAVRYNGDVVIESFTQDVAIIARAAAIWRTIEPSRESIAVDGLRFLKRTLG
jgi:D-psicose/D-tagatose/L-ribulose 3-epimerase